MIKTKAKIDKRKTDMRNVQDNTGCGEITARNALHECKGYVDLAILCIESHRRPSDKNLITLEAERRFIKSIINEVLDERERKALDQKREEDQRIIEHTESELEKDYG